MSIITDLSIINSTTFISFIVFFLIILYIFSESRRKNLPPGPINLPVVGYAPFMVGKTLENAFLELKKKYGDVVYFRIGSASVVALNSYDAIKEGLIMNSDTAATRPFKFNINSYIFYNKGIIMENGKIWQEHRRFIVAALRDLGFGKENLESQIREQALALIKEVKNYSGQPFDPELLLMRTSANIISALTFGKRYEYDDPAFGDVMKVFLELGSAAGPFHILTAFPYLRFIMPDFLSGLAKLNRLRDEFHKFAEEKIEEHETMRNHVRDYSEMYLNKQKQDEANGKLDTSFNRERLRSQMLSLSSAGTNTTASSMRWALKMLIKFPTVQTKIQVEIDAVIGSERVPTYSDRLNMPYMEAFLLEAQRYASLVPFAVPHATLVDTKILGYHIPAGVTVLPMFFMVHNDPKIWGDPENFRPERFLDDQAKSLKSDFLIPFGMGKRSCPGENLAKTEIFIFLTNFLQHFTISASSNEDLLIATTANTITRDLLPFKIAAQQRPK